LYDYQGQQATNCSRPSSARPPPVPSSSSSSSLYNNTHQLQSQPQPQPQPQSQQKATTKRLFQDALAYSKVHYEQDDQHFSVLGPAATVLLRDDPSGPLTLEALLSMKDLVLLALDEENEQLEALIASLQSSMMAEAHHDDSSCNTATAATFSSSPFATNNCLSATKVHGKHHLQQHLQQQQSVLGATGTTRTLDDKFLTEQVVVDRDLRSNNNNNNNQNKDSPLTGDQQQQQPHKQATSRFRQRLRGAQAELFLVDDF
jgi:hypothetical protein